MKVFFKTCMTVETSSAASGEKKKKEKTTIHIWCWQRENEAFRVLDNLSGRSVEKQASWFQNKILNLLHTNTYSDVYEREVSY